MKKLTLLLILLFAFNFGWAQQKTANPKQVPAVQNPSTTVRTALVPNSSQTNSNTKPSKANSEVAFPAGDPNGNYTAKIIPAEGGTYGYEILKEGRPMIRQATIPGMPGNAGFKKEADAKKVADAVIIKLRKGEMPPTVSEEELKQMNIVK